MKPPNMNPLQIETLSSSFQSALGPFDCNQSGQSPSQAGLTEDVNSRGSPLPFQASQEALTSPTLHSPSQLRNRLHNQLTPKQQFGIPLVLMLQPTGSLQMANSSSSSLTQRPRSFITNNNQRDIHTASPSSHGQAPELIRIDFNVASHSRDGQLFHSCSENSRLSSPPSIGSSSVHGIFNEATTILSDESFSSTSTSSSTSSPPPTLAESPFSALIRPLGSFSPGWHWSLDRKPANGGSSLLGHKDIKLHSKPYRKLHSESAHGVAPTLTSKRVNKWDRRLQAETVHQRRRRLQRIAFYGSFFITCGVFLWGLGLIRFRSHQIRVSLSNGLLDKVGLSSKLHDAAFFSAVEAPERDTLVLYRIIGNDLPPRHSAGQTLTNLKFILEHESKFENFPSLIASQVSAGAAGPASKLQLKRFFVLNRIANGTQLEKVQEMLTTHGVKSDQILVNPFDAEAYRAQPLNWSPEVGWGAGMEKVWGIENDRSHLAQEIEPNPLNAPAHQQITLEDQRAEENVTWSNRNMSMIRWRVLDYTYHSKNLYAMNNNGGRNFALEHGRRLVNARWILPLDGNCFFTPSALHSLVDSLQDTELRPDVPSHVVIPMSRLLGNDHALAQNSPINLSGEENEGHPRLPSQRPDAPDEPQIGFRFSSRETFSREMRYGRRSKLEFLWRLGAIERKRNLDTRSADWEVTEKSILTPESYGSIRQVARGPRRPSALSNSPAPADFIRAGWVLRLFSGDQSQEKHSEFATIRRSINRMKGIASFLESLDEAVARGGLHCAENNPSQECGFADWRLWSLNGAELEKWKYKYLMGDKNSIQFVDRLTDFSRLPMRFAASILAGEPLALGKANDLESVSLAVFVLALAAYMLDSPQYAEAAAGLVSLKFLQPSHFMSTPNAFKVNLNSHLQSLRLQADYDGTGYSFPILRHGRSLPKWMDLTSLHYLPFNPHTFDPTLLLDGIRLLSGTWQAPAKMAKSLSQTLSLSSSPLPHRQLMEIFTLQTSYLLFNASIVPEVTRQFPNKAAGLEYDLKLAALASFTDDARLLGRIASRNQIRLPLSLFSADAQRAPLLDWDPATTLAIDVYRRFRRGLKNVQLSPFDQQRLPSVISVSHESFQDSFHLSPSRFSHFRSPSDLAQAASVSHPSLDLLLPAFKK